MATPTKIVPRGDISPRTKELFCLVCFQEVEKADYRRKLLSSKGKTNVCRDLELLLGDTIVDVGLVTNTVCRNCATKNNNCVKQISDVRQKFRDTQLLLQTRGQVSTSVKRLCRPYEEIPECATKRRSKELFPPTTTHRDCSTQTTTCPEPSEVATVKVCYLLSYLTAMTMCCAVFWFHFKQTQFATPGNHNRGLAVFMTAMYTLLDCFGFGSVITNTVCIVRPS
jgi:hypothetical protein